MHQMAIAYAIRPATGIDPANPQAPHIAFSFPPMNISIIKRMEHCLMRSFIKVVSSCSLPPGKLQYFIVPASAVDA
jgi:hypothetical protein